MTSAATQAGAALPENPVKKALGDSDTQTALFNHALAILGRYMSQRPAWDRVERAREACQETYARALQKSHDYDSARPVRPWLHGILNHVLFEVVRGLRRLSVQESADGADWEQLMDLGAEPPEIVRSRMDAAGYLGKLPPEHKALIALRFYDGLTPEEIAARLGISTGGARVRLCRALNMLRQIAGAAPQEDRP
jgi:RNA polymerase sigma-70 factor (ECF subfamily)